MNKREELEKRLANAVEGPMSYITESCDRAGNRIERWEPQCAMVNLAREVADVLAEQDERLERLEKAAKS